MEALCLLVLGGFCEETLACAEGILDSCLFSPTFEGGGQLPSVDWEVNPCGLMSWDTAAIRGSESGPLLDQEPVMPSLWTSGLQNSDKYICSLQVTWIIVL